jgi:hypothetical protein
MLKRGVTTLWFVLLVGAASWAQTGFLGLVPGQSTRQDAVRALGQPVRTVSATLLEFSPQSGTGKIEVGLRAGSDVVERIEVHFLRPIVRTALLQQLGLPEAPATSGNTQGRLVEYYGGSAQLAVTYAGGDPSSGVASLGYLSREFFESAVKEGKMSETVNLTGDWTINDGQSIYKLRLTQLGNRVSGVYEIQQGSIDGTVEGNVFKLRWDQPSNRRGGSGELTIAADGNTMTGVWSYNPKAYNSGLTSGGQWTFSRRH